MCELEQLGEYFAYLDEFFETPAAKPFVLEILKADPETVVGIPSLDEYAFKTLRAKRFRESLWALSLTIQMETPKKENIWPK